MDNRATFVICIDASESDDLDKGKVYQLIQDEVAVQQGLLRVIDESAEGYLYPAEWFVLLDLPEKAREALAESA